MSKINRLLAALLAASMVLTGSGITTFAQTANDEFVALEEVSIEDTSVESESTEISTETVVPTEVSTEEAATEVVSETETTAETVVATTEEATTEEVALEALTAGDFEYSEYSSDKAYITNYKGTDSNVIIPSTIDGRTVYRIGSNAFNNKNIVSVTIPDTVTTIDSSAFYNCAVMTTVNMGSGVTSIGSSAFAGCTSLEEITIPKSVTSINSNAFDSVKRIIFEEGITTIPSYACYGASQLTEVVIPSTVTRINGSVFYNCTNLETVTIPKSVVTISSGTFNGIKNIIFEEGTTSIPNDAVRGNTALESVDIPSTVTSIGTYAFYGCTGLTDFPFFRITNIGNYAFGGSGLTEVTIANGTTVNDYAFYNCKSIEKVTIGDNCILGNYSFANLSSLLTLKIGENVTKKDSTFSGSSLKFSGTCGPNLTWAINDTKKILSISGTGSMTDYTSADEVPWASYNTFFDAIYFEDGITSIGSYAFADNENITSVTIPKTVKSLGNYSFYNCENLKYIELPKALTLVGEKALYNCPTLETIVFSSNAPQFGVDALTNQTITTAFYPETETGWTTRIFKKYDKITWRPWDDTLPTHDVVLVLDESGSMSGRMDDLKKAAKSFIAGAGGTANNTRIAVVRYSTNAYLVSDFTNDVSSLMNDVDSLKSNGNTNYCNALTLADDLLKTSSASYKTVILFSDGSPTDSHTSIYNLADNMRTRYNMFTVGLGTADSQREVLRTVAGSPQRYFEATDVQALVQAFLELITGIKRKDETTVEIKRHNERRDLLTEKEKFCLNSSEEVSIIVTPGNLRGNISKIAITQNNKVILSNTTGTFENIQPGKIFTPGHEIYVELYDAKNVLVESLDIGVSLTDSFQVTYYMNDGTDTVYKEEMFTGGTEIVEPEAPTREGYKFQGWYTSENCTGMAFFSYMNYYNRINTEDDIRLFAKWKEAGNTFDITEDAYHFINSSDNFGYGVNYEISDGDFAKLLDAAGDDNGLKSRLKAEKAESWGGSCFGMSSSAVLARQGEISISDFDASSVLVADTRLVANTAGDADVGAVESMINYYQLLQLVGNVNNVRTSYDGSNESPNAKKIIEKLESTGEPIVMTIRLTRSNGSTGGHAVVAYDLTKNADESEYKFKVWDCSISYTTPYTVTVTKVGGTYSVECSEWEAAWGRSIFLKAALSTSDIMSESILTAPGIILASGDPGVENKDYYEFVTNYSSFTISNGSASATVSNGSVSGSLGIQNMGSVSESIDSEELLFKLPVLEDGDVYTIIPSAGGSDVDTQISYAHSEDGFYGRVTAEANGTIKIDSDGVLTSSYESNTRQTITVAKTAVNTPWYYVQFNGTNTGYTAGIGSEETSIKSVTAGTIDVTVESDMNSLTFDNVSVDSDGIRIVKDGENNCKIIKGTDETSKTFGYSVVFDSQSGETVPTIRNIAAGSKITEPLDPRRDGFVFQGWYKEKECNNLWDFTNDTVEKDTVLYAGWSLDANYFVNVTFNIAGVDSESIYVARGSKISTERCPVIPSTDKNWYVDEDFTTKWSFDSDEVIENMTLYAKGDPCTVSFVTNCSLTIDDVNTIGGKRIDEPEMTSADRAGYTFVGWYSDSALKNSWNFKKNKVSHTMTLYAKWIKNETDSNGKDTGICIEQFEPETVVYTGGKVVPNVIVRDGGKVLKAGVDYKITYKNNINACDVATTSLDVKKQPQYVVQGIGIYKSNKSFTRTFSIYPAEVSGLTIDVPTEMAVNAKQNLQKIKTTVKAPGKTLGAKEYTVNVYRNLACTDKVEGVTSEGKYYVVIEAAKNEAGQYAGNVTGKSKVYTVNAVNADKMIAKASIKSKNTQTVNKSLTADQTIATIITAVKCGKTTYTTDVSGFEEFKANFEITAIDSNNRAIPQSQLNTILMTSGKKTIIVKPSKANANGYVGEKRFTITVNGQKLKSTDFVLTYADTKSTVVKAVDYTGSNMCPNLFTSLKEGKDYTAKYYLGKNEIKKDQIVNAGTYKLALTGINDYSGTVNITFKINRVNIAKAYSSGKMTVMGDSTVTFDITGTKSTVRLTYDADSGSKYSRMSLAEGVDFTVSYTNNKKISTTSGRKMSMGVAVVTGKGNYCGALKGSSKKTHTENPLSFAVTRKSISSSDVTFVVTSLTEKRGKYTAKLIGYDKGKKIGGSDYKVYVYSSGTQISITGQGRYSGSRTITTSKSLVSVTSKNIIITYDKNNLYYTGEQIVPAVTIQDKSVMSEITENFDITYGENTKLGVGTITITGKPEKGYCGQKVIKFTILPKWARWLF